MSCSPKTCEDFVELVEKVAKELESLETKFDVLEAAVAQIMGKSDVSIDSDTVAELQGVDTLRQSIAAISVLLYQTSLNQRDSEMKDVSVFVDAMPLRDLSSRLKGEFKSQADRSGVELF